MFCCLNLVPLSFATVPLSPASDLETTYHGNSFFQPLGFVWMKRTQTEFSWISSAPSSPLPTSNRRSSEWLVSSNPQAPGSQVVSDVSRDGRVTCGFLRRDIPMVVFLPARMGGEGICCFGVLKRGTKTRMEVFVLAKPFNQAEKGNLKQHTHFTHFTCQDQSMSKQGKPQASG